MLAADLAFAGPKEKLGTIEVALARTLESVAFYRTTASTENAKNNAHSVH